METTGVVTPLPELLHPYEDSPDYRVARCAVTAAGLKKVARVPERAAAVNTAFTVQVTPQGAITNQKRSGRCWMFAALNVFRRQVMMKANLETFEFSQAWTLYWDKLERTNWFLNQMVNLIDEPLDGRVMSFMLTDPLCDGGQWDMLVSIVKKYGLVPKEAMPETECSSNTSEMDYYLTKMLRSFAAELRACHTAGDDADALRAKIPAMLDAVERALRTCLGEPPTTFDFRARTKGDDAHTVEELGITPRAFFDKYAGMDLDDYVSVICANTADKPYMRTFTVELLGNVAEDGQVKYLNLPIERLKQLACAQLRDNEPVWFGSDVAQDSVRDDGLLDPAAIDVASVFGAADFSMDRATRLAYGDSVMTHAMVLQGVSVGADGAPTSWRVENSWGKDFGKDGFYVMSDAWFSEYVYQVAINKKYLTSEELAAWQTEPISLRPWDPMGTLAR